MILISPQHSFRRRLGAATYRQRDQIPTRDQLFQDSLLRRLKLEFNGKSHELDSLTLRDSCPCSRCIDPSTTQRLFNTTDIPTTIRAKDLEVNADGSFSVSWTQDVAGFENHRSHFPSSFLSPRKYPKGVEASMREKYPRILWDRADLEAIEHDLTVKYDDYMADERTLHLVTRQLFQYGIAFISNVPPVSESVASIGNRIGPLKKTIYGSTWDVRSLSSPKNVASTSSDLGFHMDLLYYKEPPKLQILHFIKQSHWGGESLFSDSFKAVSTLVRDNFDPFDLESRARISGRSLSVIALTQFLYPFHYKNNGHWLEYAHCTIVVDKAIGHSDWSKVSEHMVDSSNFEAALQAVRWSPPFQAPIHTKLREDRVPSLDYWIRGARLLKKEFERKKAVFQTRMEEGTCVIFDNWRILHARRAFSGGERWLKGAYIDDDIFRQRVLKLDNSDT